MTLPIRFKCGNCKKVKVEARFPCASEFANNQAFEDFKVGKIYETGFLCFECQKKMGLKVFPILEKSETI